MASRQFLLIDFENVRPANLALLEDSGYSVMVFLGAHQSKIPVDFARALQKLGPNAQYVQISGNGPNAVDFHIAFTIGELSAANPDASFHIVSKDTGFDPLVRYAKSKGIVVRRCREISTLPLSEAVEARYSDDRLSAVVKNLSGRGSARPRKVRTLASTINALFQKRLSDDEVADVIEALQREGHVNIDGESVTYHFQS